MSKKDREAKLSEGRRQLAAWGVGAQASVAELAAVAHRDPAADLAIAERLGAIASEESLRLLEALEQRADTKLLRREIQRSRFRLQQRGIAAARQEAQQPREPESRQPTDRAFLTDFAHDDLRAALIVHEALGMTEGALAFFQPEALEDCLPMRGSRRRMEATFARACRQLGFESFPADPAYVDFLLCRAEREGRTRGAIPEASYLTLRRRWFGNETPDHLPCPIARLLDVEALRAEPQWLERSAELVDLYELQKLVIDRQLQPYVEKLLGAAESPLVLSAAQIADREAEVVAEALEGWFTGAARERWIHRLEELAYAFFQQGRVDEAKMALAVVIALRDDESAHRRIPFCRKMLSTALLVQRELILSRKEEEAKESLIVPPRPPSPSRPRRR